jgi:uncharacterized protein YndB with AHSA1/START domain
VRISSDRSYRFELAPADLWSAIEEVDAFPRWWPWLKRFEAEALEAGDVWRCTVQPPLPYTLSFDITIDELVPHDRVAASISGEISGTAELTVAPTDEGCTARLTSRLAPSSRFLQGVALVARPVVTLGHDWVLDTGARQFRRHLRQGG